MPRTELDRVLDSFGALARTHGLATTSTRHPRDGLTVTLENEEVCLVVHCEPFAPPWASIGPPGGPTFGIHELDPNVLGVELPALAAHTARLGARLLAGDHSEVPRLLRERTVRLRTERQRDWGTATGESPRFSERPSLDALFADAGDSDGIIDARCYQAVWDWGFSLTELAEHLVEEPATVQGRLDRWEGLSSS